MLPIIQSAPPSGSSKLVQRVWSSTGAVATGTTTTPDDDTIPTSTEGDQYLSQAITPTDANNIIRVFVSIHVSQSAGNHRTAALFNGGSAAVAAVMQYNTTNGRLVGAPMTIYYEQTAGGTSAITFTVRVGASSAATITVNGESGARLLGGVMISSIMIEEVTP